MKKGPKIVVGTPGRTLDHIERGTLKLGKVAMAVLDEADEMLDMGFRVDIQKILRETPKSRQTVLFSATMSRAILDLTKKFQRDPKLIKVASDKQSPLAIEQTYFDVEASGKTKLLTQLLTEHSPKLSIVFCNTRRKVDAVCRALRSRGFYSALIHGDIKQSKRDSIMKKFRSEKVKILVATDVAARGIDVSNVEAVFNYNIPKERESYVHRIGRTGRAGKAGKAISLVARDEQKIFRNIMKYAKTKIEQGSTEGLPDLDFLTERKKDRHNEDRPSAPSRKDTRLQKALPSQEKETAQEKRAARKKEKALLRAQASIATDSFAPGENEFLEDPSFTGREHRIIGKINKRLRKKRRGELSKYLLMMGDLVDDDNSLEDVSAMLLKMVVEGRARS